VGTTKLTARATHGGDPSGHKAARIPAGPFRGLAGKSDDDLVKLARLGEGRAIEALYARYSAAILRYCCSILRSPQEAEDIQQEVFLHAIAALRRGPGPASFRPWLYRVAHNACISHLRSRRPTLVAEDSVLPVATTEPETAHREELRELLADIGRLSEVQRGALLLREMDGFSYDEIARLLGLPVTTVRSTIFRARSTLQGLAEARDANCDSIQAELSQMADRRGRRSRRITSHLRVCEPCRQFRESLRYRSGVLGTYAPASRLDGLRNAKVAAVILALVAVLAGATLKATAAQDEDGSRAPTTALGHQTSPAPVPGDGQAGQRPSRARPPSASDTGAHLASRRPLISAPHEIRLDVTPAAGDAPVQTEDMRVGGRPKTRVDDVPRHGGGHRPRNGAPGDYSVPFVPQRPPAGQTPGANAKGSGSLAIPVAGDDHGSPTLTEPPPAQPEGADASPPDSTPPASQPPAEDPPVTAPPSPPAPPSAPAKPGHGPPAKPGHGSPAKPGPPQSPGPPPPILTVASDSPPAESSPV
jgi:RNA polymerase sigma factor (sigma-70 family)